MTEFLERWFGRRAEAPRAPATSRPAPPLILRPDTTLPIVDWSAMDAHAPATDDREALDAFWSSVAYGWLDALRVKLGSRYAVRESEHFLLLSPLEELRARARVVQARPVPVVGMVRRRSGG